MAGGYSAQYSGKKSYENNRYFLSNMQEVCRHLAALMVDVYKQSFKDTRSGIRFTINTVPRIEVNNIAEIIQLTEAGLLDAQDARRLVGDLTGKRKVKKLKPADEAAEGGRKDDGEEDQDSKGA